MVLREDLYILDYDDSHFIYSPLRRALFFADNSSVDIVNRYLANTVTEEDKNSKVWEHIMRLESIAVEPPQKHQIRKGSTVIIIPTQTCNFACTYCYAQNAHQYKSIMSYETLKTVLDYVLNSENKKKNISFIGGGEPLTAWHLIQWAVEYLEKNKKVDDVLNIGITTNASLFTDEMLQYIKDHKIHIGVSFEILADIQNSQRPFIGGKRGSFEVVDHNIQKLIDYNIPYGIRSTITKLNVNRMSEMVEFVAMHYPNIRRLHLEQVTDSSEDDTLFYDEFIKYFYEAKKIGKQYNIEVYNSISKSIHQIKECFCGGEFCVSPTGSLVACHRVSAEHEKAFALFNYGKVNESSCVFYENAEKNYMDFSKMKRPECAQCFAKWHCAGICPMERTELSPQQILAKCDFVKKIVTRELYDSLIAKLDYNDN